MKYWWFLNTRREFRIKWRSLVSDLNNLPMPLAQISKFKKKSLLPFAVFRIEVIVLLLCPLMSAILWRLAPVTVFANFLENKSRSEQKKYITLIRVSLREIWTFFIFRSCAIFLGFYAVFGDILSQGPLHISHLSRWTIHANPLSDRNLPFNSANIKRACFAFSVNCKIKNDKMIM